MTEHESVLDSRFETDAEDVEHLLSLMDIDDLEELETFLMILFARPVTIREEQVEETGAPSVEVVLHEHGTATGSVFPFPVSVVEIVRGAIENATTMEPYDDTLPRQDLAAMDHAEFLTALQLALGQVRILDMLDDD